MKKFLIICDEVKKIYKTKSKKRLKYVITLCLVFDCQISRIPYQYL